MLQVVRLLTWWAAWRLLDSVAAPYSPVPEVATLGGCLVAYCVRRYARRRACERIPGGHASLAEEQSVADL